MVQASIASASEYRIQARETSAHNHGAHAFWSDPTFSGIYCSTTPNVVNSSDVVIESLNASTNSLVAVGYHQYLKNPNCTPQNVYIWQKQTVSGGAVFNVIASPSPRGSHSFRVMQRSDICGGGASWCWSFEIDEVSKHTCCADMSELSDPGRAQYEMFCTEDDPSHIGCPATGIVDPAFNLSRRNVTDTDWVPWAGKDGDCVDLGGDGKWNSDVSITAAWTTTVTGGTAFAGGC